MLWVFTVSLLLVLVRTVYFIDFLIPYWGCNAEAYLNVGWQLSNDALVINLHLNFESAEYDTSGMFCDPLHMCAWLIPCVLACTWLQLSWQCTKAGLLLSA